MPEKPGYTFGELLKLISNGKMSLAQASYYGHSFYNIESALAYLEKALQSHGEEVRRRTIEECAVLAESDLQGRAHEIRKLLEVKGA